MKPKNQKINPTIISFEINDSILRHKIKLAKVFLIPVVSALFFLLFIFSHNLRFFITKQLEFPFNIMDKISNSIELKKIEKLSWKNYVYVKKEFLKLKK
jgi:hypothetical protein